MALGILVLLSALSISAVAIYYSIAGLVAIFAAAAIPIMVMGTVLEVGKLVTAVWLHKYWGKAVWWLKTYLSVAVVVLMFITSMGIFGYLSKAHIEQTSASIESTEKINQIDTEIARYTNIVTRSETKIDKAENAGANKNDTIQDQIDREQKRIDTAYTRIQPLVDKQELIIEKEMDRKDNKIKPYLAQVSSIDADLETLTNLLNRRDNESIRRLQSIVGTRIDGTYGSRTAKQVENYRDGLLAKRESILETILQIEDKESSLVIAANEEIKRLRAIAEQEIADSNKVINKLRSEIGTVVTDNSTELVQGELLKIKNANNEIELLTEEKYKLEAEYRKLEAEVGPIKYIAEFVYGEEADRDLLEEAVRWVIILIIFVFDPLAVLLLIASQYTFDFANPKRRGLAWREYEQARAKKIMENIDDKSDTDNTITEPEDDGQDPRDEKRDDLQEINVGSDERDRETTDEPSVQPGETVEETKEQVSDNKLDNTEEWQELYDDVEKKDSESSEESKTDLDSWNEWVEAANKEAEKEVEKEPEVITGIGAVKGTFKQAEVEKQKQEEVKDLGEDITPEQISERSSLVQKYDQDSVWSEAKRVWKSKHPDQNIKDWKHAYISGRIHELPWQQYLDYKDQEVQKALESRIKPDLTEVINPDGYEQNAEQSEKSVWNKIRDKDK
tara:strand:+ start:7110 stop:9134 length:2025 start_codon:yes stop_codon:yes gene_type:complete